MSRSSKRGDNESNISEHFEEDVPNEDEEENAGGGGEEQEDIKDENEEQEYNEEKFDEISQKQSDTKSQKLDVSVSSKKSEAVSRIEKSNNVSQSGSQIKINNEDKKSVISIDNNKKKNQIKVEYRKNNYLIYLREVNGGKFKSGGKKASDSLNIKNLVYFRIGQKNWIEGRLPSTIEVPFERSQTEESIEFRLAAICEDEEIVLSRSFFLKSLGLTNERPTGSFVCVFDNIDSSKPSQQLIYFKFALAFDAAILASSEEKPSPSVSISQTSKQRRGGSQTSQEQATEYSSELSVFSVCLKQINSFEEFAKKRKEEIREKLILATSTSWHCRYRLDVSLKKQKYFFYLDDPEREDICVFYNPGMGELILTLEEQLYEKYELQDYGRGGFSETKLKSLSNLGEVSIDLESIKGLKKGFKDFSEPFNQKFLSLDYCISLIPSKAQFHNKFIGYSGIKILETVIFDQSIQPSHLEVSLFSMDNQLLNQVWKLTPFSSYSNTVHRVSLWDSQHDLVYKKNLEVADQNENSSIPENLFSSLLSQESKNIPIDLGEDFPLDEDFKLHLKNYGHILNYQPVLRQEQKQENPSDLEFSHKNNHFFFKTSCPFDYFQIKLFAGDPRKPANLIGFYEESLFKVPENSLLLGYLYKDPDGRVDSQFNQVNSKKGAGSAGDATILDNEKNDEIVGTIKFTADFFGLNKYLIQDSSQWVNEIENYQEDSDSLIDQIKVSLVNQVQKEKKIMPLRLSLVDIWNLSDLIEQIVPVTTLQESIDIKIKLGLNCYAISLAMQRINKSLFQKGEILFKLEKENSKCVSVKEGDKLILYTISGNSVVQTIINTYISSSLIFSITSTYECIILEMRAVSQGEEIITFCSEQVKNLTITGRKGVLVLPLQIPDKQKRNSQNQFIKGQKVEFFSSVAYFKFNFEFLKEENFDLIPVEGTRGLFTLGLFIPPQIKITKDKSKQLKKFVYLLTVQEVTTKRKFEKNLSFGGGITTKFSLDYFKKFEFLKSSDLFILVKVKKIYSGNMEEDEEDANYIFEKQYHINPSINPKIEDINPSIPIQKIKVELGNFLPFSCKFKDEGIQQELEFILQINYKFSYFIDNPQQFIYASIPIELEQKMSSNDIIETDTSILLKLTSLSKEAQKAKKSVQEKQLEINKKKKTNTEIKEATFESFDFRDNFLLEINSGMEVIDTSIVKISDLLLLPLDPSIQIPSDAKMVASTFINFSNKKLEFAIRMKERFPKAERSVLSSQQQQIQSLSEKEQEKSVNISKHTQQQPNYDAYTLKKMIKEKEAENMKLMTELQRDKKEIIKQQNAIIELEDIQRRSNSKTMETKKIKRSTAPIELSEQANKAKQLFLSICQCGAANPKYKGFCEECIEKMKADYKLKYDEYKIIADKYEGLYVRNRNIDSKILKMKQKIESFQKEAALVDTDQNTDKNGDEKLLLDEIDFIRQNVKLTQGELKMMKSDQQRVVSEKCSLQSSLENKIAKKIQKLTQLHNETEEFKKKRLDLEEKIDKINNQYMQQRENI